jgi:hypothetical protein
MRSPETSWALTFLGGPHGAPPVLLASDGYAVYRWDGSRWLVQTPQYSVVSLDPVGDGTVFSSSMGDGIDVGSLAGAGGTLRWRPADGGLEDRRTGGARGIHVVSVTDDGGPTEYAGTMLDGVFVSLDGGKSWSGVWTGLASHGVVSRVVSVDGMLVAATDGGILAYEMPPVQPASPSWWALVILVGLISGAAGAAVLLRRRSDSLPTALLRRRSH